MNWMKTRWKTDEITEGLNESEALLRVKSNHWSALPLNYFHVTPNVHLHMKTDS